MAKEILHVKGNAPMILNQLRILTKLVQPKEGNIAVGVSDSNFRIYSMNDMATYQSLVPSDLAEGNTVVGISIDAFRTILSGRKDVDLELVNGMLVIKEGKYKAEIPTTDAVEVQAISEKLESTKDEKTKSWNVDEDHSKWLKNAISDVTLKVPDSLGAFMPLTIKVSNKGAFVICYDATHISFIMANAEDISGELELTMPTDMLASVFDAFCGHRFKLIVSESNLMVKSKLMTITLQLPITDSYIDIKKLFEVSKSSIDADGDWLSIDRSALAQFLDSCRAVASKERSELVVNSDGKKAQFTVRTVNGNITQLFETKSKKVKFKIDFGYFDEAFRKGTSEAVEFKVISDSSLVMQGKNKNGWSVISLNGD